MTIPQQIRAGDTIKWRDAATFDVFGNEVTSASWTLTYFFRYIDVASPVSVVGVAYGSGWEFTISATTSGNFYDGQWFWQSIASKASEKLTLSSGQLQVLSTLNTAGAMAYDGRSQTEKDLETVQGAIRTIIAGGAVSEYSIGTGSGGRRLKRMTISELIELESKLKADLVREKRAEKIANGLGDPRKLYVRFRG